jgi:hypothetical protein
MVQYFPDLVMPKNTYIVMVEAKAFLNAVRTHPPNIDAY